MYIYIYMYLFMYVYSRCTVIIIITIIARGVEYTMYVYILYTFVRDSQRQNC